ncbi:MAG: DUF3604 domain-containing protein [Candidatus Heimdallarchaeota archaeon]|nr:MAG: DUF3604 domain-containing protein [Candidatus Heimdallarchaeota archaeon]
MPTDDRDITYGYSNISPKDDVVAGSYGTWILTFTVGTHGIDDGGHIKIAWRDVSNWGRPQFQNPGDFNFCTVNTTGKAELDVRFERRGYIRPWRPCLIITIFDGFLTEGDTVTIIYGDTGEEGGGSKSQTFVEDSFEFRVLVDPFGTGQYTIVPNPPVLKVIAGEPEVLRVIAPSETVIGISTWLSVRIEDIWGNPTSQYEGTVVISSNDSNALLPPPYTYTPEDGGTHRFENLTFQTPGLNYITAQDVKNEELHSTSNPMLTHENQLKMRLYWGDLHGQTEETIGTGTVVQYFRFARDAALDFVSHVGNDFQITKDHYKDTQRIVKEFHKPGKFITFLGYEWSGNSPAGGDHNVYFLKDDQPIHRSSHTQVQDKSDEETDRYPISRLLETFHGRDDVMIIPHVGGRHAILDYHDPGLTPFIEICSVHGHFEWFVREAMEKGLKIGFIGGSDDHTCRPGGAHPTSMVEAVRGGLMGVYACELTRDSLWDAFRKRHVFATTGTRIVLRVTCGDAMMGDEITLNQSPTFFVEIYGTTGLESVEIVRDLDVIHNHQLIQYDLTSNTIKFVWSGARVTTRRRNTDWSGEITIDKGRIISAEEFAFDLSWQGITELTEQRVCWSSTTSGDLDGIIMTLEAPDDARISFDTEIVQTSFQLSQLKESLILEAGGIEQKLEISRVSGKKPPISVKFEYTDHNIKSGRSAYYVKVLQIDGEKAWSSPIFINYV